MAKKKSPFAKAKLQEFGKSSGKNPVGSVKFGKSPASVVPGAPKTKAKAARRGR